MKTTTLLSTLLLGVSLLAGNALADSKYNLVPQGTAKFTPVDPKNPSLQISVVAGDLKTGPVTFFLKLGKGPAPIHWHTSDYSAVVVEGQTKHWLPGKEADAKVGGPGTAWFQPGGSAKDAHGDECLSDGCTIFIVMPKKFDMTVAPPAKDAKPATPAKK